MEVDEQGPFPRLREYFPRYLPYGLREFVTARDHRDILRWMVVALQRSPDALSAAHQAGFVHWAESLATEAAAGTQAVARLLAVQGARSRRTDEDIAKLNAIRSLLKPSGGPVARSAGQWADLLDNVIAVAKAILAHADAPPEFPSQLHRESES